MRRYAIFVLTAAASLVLAAGCSSGDDSSSPGPKGPSASASPSTNGDHADKDVIDNPPAKTWQDALDAAHQEFSGDVSKIELESAERGGLEYKIELMSADTKYAVQYDADTLDKLSDEHDDLGDDSEKKRKETFDPQALIDLDDAVKVARQQQDGTITAWKIEGKDTGRVQYEFDIVPDGSAEDVEVTIDAKDGSVIPDS